MSLDSYATAFNFLSVPLDGAITERFSTQQHSQTEQGRRMKKCKRKTAVMAGVASVIFVSAIFTSNLAVHCSVRQQFTPLTTEREKRTSNLVGTVYPDFQWVNPNATISVDLDLNDVNTASFLELLYFTQSKRLEITCPKEELMGGTHVEGGWDVCIAEPYNLVQPCLVYSIGMSEPSQWGFDRTVTSKYGCKDMAYDPTIGKETQKINDRMWFFNVGLGGRNGVVNNREFKTLETILKDNDHTEITIDIMKIDIECSEWRSFDAIFASPQCLDNVKQLMIEFHPCRFKHENKTPQELLGYWRTLRGINELGFKLWKVWNNYVCRFPSRRLKGVEHFGCFNAYYLNIKYLL